MRGNSDYRYDAGRIMANLEDYLDYLLSELLSDYGAGLHEFRYQAITLNKHCYNLRASVRPFTRREQFTQRFCFYNLGGHDGHDGHDSRSLSPGREGS